MAPAGLAHAQAPEILYYQLNEGTGDTLTNGASPGAGSASPQFSPVVAPTWISPGQLGPFAANTGGLAVLPTGYTANLLNATSWTVEFWIRKVDTASTLSYVFGDGSSNFRCFTGGVAGNSIILRGAGLLDLQGVTSLDDLLWHHIAWVYDQTGQTTTLYIDGVQEAQNTGQSLNITATGDLIVFNDDPSTSNALRHDLDEFRLFNSARSQTQIQAEMNVELGFTDPDLGVQRPAGTPVFPGATDTLAPLPIGTPSTITYTIENQGATLPLNLTGTPLVDLSNFSNCTATVTTPPTTPINAGATTTFNVEITPSADPWFFDVSIASNDPLTNPYNYRVAGPSPSMDVQRPLGISIANTGSDSVGIVNTGTPTTFTYNILNTGATDLDLTGTPLVAIASLANCTATVTTTPTSPVSFPTGSTTFDIEVTVTAPGPFSFDVSIDNNDPANNPYTFTVDGAAPLSGTFDVGGGALDFADIGAAFDALEMFGVAGPVTFEVYDDPGIYTATTSYELNTFTGMGPTNQVTVQAAAGESPVITGAVNIMSSGPDVIVYLENVSGVSIIGLEFDGQGTDQAAIGWYNSGTIADGHTIERCRIHGFQGSAIGLYDPGSPSEFVNCLIANNFVWDCQAISFSTYDDGVLWGRRMGGTRVIHNTFVHGATAVGEMFHHQVSGAGTELAELSNNIFYNDVSGTNMYSNAGGNPAVADGNIWYLGTGVSFSAAAPLTFADWQALGLDANGLNADPLLVDPANGDLHLQNPSPAHDRAVVTTPPLTVDIDGDTRPAGIADDIGADEEPSPVPQPAISIQRPVGVALASGGTDALGTATIQSDFNLTYTIANSGAGDLVINSATLTNQTNCTATVQLAPTSPVTSGNSSSMIVTVNVTATGAFSFDIEVDTNDLFNPLFTITVSGSGIAEPELSVQRPVGTIVASGGIDLLSPGGPGATQVLTYTIENAGLATLNLTGTTPVTVASVSNTTATVTVQPVTSTLAPAATTTFSIEITSISSGYYSATITIASDDPNNSPYTFTILGDAITISTSSGSSSSCATTHVPGAGNGTLVLILSLAFCMALAVAVRRRVSAG